MTVIGVTGPSGAGKSLFCSYLEELGCLHLDCDKIYHDLVDSPSECTRALEAEFGASVIKPDGSLDRIALGAIVFAPGADKLRGKLNEITHAFVLAEVRKAIAETDKACAVIDAPLLFEANFEKECNFTVALLASPELRLSRLTLRDNRTAEALKARMNAAPADEFYSSRATYTVINDGDADKLRAAANDILVKAK
ncbi:MAG: dephospho-CoA kinase [Clostridia bacterium]|nr:dephospho-CoA kinase [Clostridia bacterium]